MRRSDETHGTWIANIGAFFFFFLLSCALTWPLVRDLSTTVADHGDPLLNTWILDWVSHALTHAPLRLFSGPIFHPMPLAIALSEHMTGIALLVLPFHLAGLPAVSVYNIAILLSFALSGFGMFVLARVMTRDTLSSLTAGVFYAFVPFKFDHLSHVQILASGWIPLTFAALLLFWRSGSRRDAALFTLAFVMNGLSNVYWLLFTGFAVVVTIVYLESTGRRFPRKRLASALLASALLLLPFLVPYQIVAKRERMQRTSMESRGGSATWNDWLVASPASRLYGREGAGRPERNLFPGILALLLGAIGGAATLRFGAASRAPGEPLHTQRRWILPAAATATIAGCALVPWHRSDVPFMVAAVLAAAAVPWKRACNPEAWAAALWLLIGFVGSFGEHSFLHSFLFRLVEPFHATRTPARWAILAYCGLAVLAALGATRLKRWRVALLLTAIVEAMPLIHWQHVPAEFPPVYSWLAKTRPAAVIELPIGWNETEAGYVLASTVHRVPLMNGVSGFNPPLHERLSALPYDEEMLDLIRRNGATVAVVHPSAAVRARPWIERGELREIARFADGDVAYAIAPPGR